MDFKSATSMEELSKQRLLDERYLRMARIWSENSYCKRRQVGALIVKHKSIISDGYNGTPFWVLRIYVRTRTIIPNLTYYMQKRTLLPRLQNPEIAVMEPRYMLLLRLVSNAPN